MSVSAAVAIIGFWLRQPLQSFLLPGCGGFSSLGLGCCGGCNAMAAARSRARVGQGGGSRWVQARHRQSTVRALAAGIEERASGASSQATREPSSAMAASRISLAASVFACASGWRSRRGASRESSASLRDAFVQLLAHIVFAGAGMAAAEGFHQGDSSGAQGPRLRGLAAQVGGAAGRRPVRSR